jgi:hypothetical protein
MSTRNRYSRMDEKSGKILRHPIGNIREKHLVVSPIMIIPAFTDIFLESVAEAAVPVIAERLIIGVVTSISSSVQYIKESIHYISYVIR